MSDFNIYGLLFFVGVSCRFTNFKGAKEDIAKMSNIEDWLDFNSSILEGYEWVVSYSRVGKRRWGRRVVFCGCICKEKIWHPFSNIALEYLGNIF